MKLCAVKIAVVSLLLVGTPTLGDDCVPTTAPPCTTTPACPNSGGGNGSNNNGTSTGGVLGYLQSTSECDKLADGTILLDPRHCRRYYICANKRAMRYRCSVGQWYDQSTKTCRPRADVKCAANSN